MAKDLVNSPDAVDAVELRKGYLCGRDKFPVYFAPGANSCICQICGAQNDKPADDPRKEWLGCILPEGHEFNMTSGVNGPDVPLKRGPDNKLYVDYDALIALPMDAKVQFTTSEGDPMTRAQWIVERKVDPAIELKRMRYNMARQRPIKQLG